MKIRFVKIFSTSLLAGLFLLVVSHCGSAVPAALAPDSVLYNGKIVTVDEDFSIAQAVAIRSGKFVAVGSDSEILALAGGDTERVDLEGKTVLPGFNDSHLHLSWPVESLPILPSRNWGGPNRLLKSWNWSRRELQRPLLEKWSGCREVDPGWTGSRKSAGPTGTIWIPYLPTTR